MLLPDLMVKVRALPLLPKSSSSFQSMTIKRKTCRPEQFMIMIFCHQNYVAIKKAGEKNIREKERNRIFTPLDGYGAPPLVCLRAAMAAADDASLAPSRMNLSLYSPFRPLAATPIGDTHVCPQFSTVLHQSQSPSLFSLCSSQKLSPAVCCGEGNRPMGAQGVRGKSLYLTAGRKLSHWLVSISRHTQQPFTYTKQVLCIALNQSRPQAGLVEE